MKQIIQLLMFFSLCVFSTLTFAKDTVQTPIKNWTFQTHGPIWGSTTTVDKITYIGSYDGQIYALNSDTGKLHWQVATGGPILAKITYHHDHLFVNSDDGFLYKLEAHTGKQIWRINLHHDKAQPRILPGYMNDWDYRGSSPFISNGIVYVGSADYNLTALEIGSGKVLWRFQSKGIIRSTPALAGNTLIVGDMQGEISALNAKTGQIIWGFSTHKPIPSSALIHQEIVYIGSRNTKLYALSLKNGKILWEKNYDENSWVESSAVIFDDNIYIGSSALGAIMALKANTGETIWQKKYLEGAAVSTPGVNSEAVYGGYMGYSTEFMPEGGLVKLNRQTGALIWKYTFDAIPNKYGHGLAGTPELVKDNIIFGTLDGVIYSLKQ